MYNVLCLTSYVFCLAHMYIIKLTIKRIFFVKSYKERRCRYWLFINAAYAAFPLSRSAPLQYLNRGLYCGLIASHVSARIKS